MALGFNVDSQTGSHNNTRRDRALYGTIQDTDVSNEMQRIQLQGLLNVRTFEVVGSLAPRSRGYPRDLNEIERSRP